MSGLLETSFSDPPRPPGRCCCCYCYVEPKQIGLLFGLLSETPLSLHNDNYAKSNIQHWDRNSIAPIKPS